MAHTALHSKHKNSKDSLLNTLKTEQIQSKMKELITPGIFINNYKYLPEYDISNFKKEYEGIIPIELGIGSYGRVYLVTNKFNNKKYALKVINKNKLMQIYSDCRLVQNEVEIHSKLNHPNIIRLYNMKETENEIQILLEYAEKGSLFDLIQKTNGLDELKAFEYFIQIVNAVYFLHQNNIIHRDIKPENILIDENNALKLCDFGWAKELNVNKRATFCGTMEYMAPEIVGSEMYDFSVDIWSLGILLYELIMGHSPFRSKSKKDRNIMIKIKKHDLVFDKDKNISKECIDLINRLLDMNPEQRLKIKDIFEHPFVVANENKIKKNKVSPRKESLDDSNENIIKFFNKKKDEKFFRLKKKFGFDKNLKLKDKISSKQLVFSKFRSDKKLISVKEFKDKKIEKKESERLLNLISQMSDELEKGKKKVDDLNFNKGKQFSFEDFRDSKILEDDNNRIEEYNEFTEDSKIKETRDNTLIENTFANDDNIFEDSNDDKSDF
jgi:serine/threonine protein kinase